MRWAADAGTQTVPHWLAADAARMADSLPCCCSRCSSCRHNSNDHWLQQNKHQALHQQQQQQDCMRPELCQRYTVGDIPVMPSSCAHHVPVMMTGASTGCSDCSCRSSPCASHDKEMHSSVHRSSSPWRFVRPGQLVSARIGTEPWIPAGAAHNRNEVLAATRSCSAQDAASTNNCCQVACAAARPKSAEAPASAAAADSCTKHRRSGSCRSGAAGGRSASPISRRQAAAAARSRARQQLEVSAKYAAVCRAAAVETAAAVRAAATQKVHGQQECDCSADAAADTDSEHEVAVIITTSPLRKSNRRSCSRPAVLHVSPAMPPHHHEALRAAAADAQRAAAMHHGAAATCYDETMHAQHTSQASTLQGQSSAPRSWAALSSCKSPKALRQLVNKRQQQAAWLPAGRGVACIASGRDGSDRSSCKGAKLTVGVTNVGRAEHPQVGARRCAVETSESTCTAGRAGHPAITNVKLANSHTASQELAHLLAELSEGEVRHAGTASAAN